MFEYLPAVERIAFQHNSSLARRVVAVCAEFLSWVEETRQPLLVGGKLPPATEGRIKAAVNYATKTFAPKLTKILADELKLNVSVMCFNDVMFNCAMMPIFKHIEFEEQAIVSDFYTGTSSYNKEEYDPTILTSLDTQIDLSKGSFEKVPNDYIMILCLFTVTYLGEEVFGGISPWTAEEHAAVILHECGHAMSIFEHIADIYHRAGTAGNSIRYLSEKADDATVLATVETMKKSQNDSRAKEFDEIVAEIEKTREKTPGLRKVVASLAGMYLGLSFIFALLRTIAAGRYGKINEGNGKTADTTVTESNSGYDERIADEFVARHGLGAALALALKKMDLAGEVYVRTRLDDALHNIILTKTIITAVSSVKHFLGMLLYFDSGTYDPMWLRLEHIVRNAMVVLKDESLSDDLRNYYLKETTKLLETIKSYTNTNRFKLHQLFWGTIMRIISRGSVIDSFHTAGLSQDYDILQRLTNGLVKNSLSYHAARLRVLQTSITSVLSFLCKRLKIFYQHLCLT